jgi:Carbohydrate binding domain (family 11)
MLAFSGLNAPMKAIVISRVFVFVLGVGATCSVNAANGPVQSVARDTAETDVIVIHSYRDGLSGVRATNPSVHLSVGRDPAMPDEPVLFVEYPAATGEPAARDVQCDAQNQNWSAGRAIAFQIKAAHPMRLSVSFFDRNRVAYTTWTELQGDLWQQVRIPFDEIRPNPYFQRPDARTGAPLDVGDVKFIAFAPQDPASGRMAIGSFVVVK